MGHFQNGSLKLNHTYFESSVTSKNICYLSHCVLDGQAKDDLFLLKLAQQHLLCNRWGFNRTAWNQIVSYTLASSSVVVRDWSGGLFGIQGVFF